MTSLARFPALSLPYVVGLLAISVASAGEFRSTPVEVRILEFLDRDDDGTLAPVEFEQFPVPMRRWLADAPTRFGDRPVPFAEFAPTLREMLGDLREGRYSTPAGRTALVAADGDRGPLEARPRPNGTWVANARYIYGQMDRNKDGKLDFGEWEGSRTIRPWFEDEGIRFTGVMPEQEFVDHMVDLQGRLDERAKSAEK